jgi:RHS repeat-associated protein
MTAPVAPNVVISYSTALSATATVFHFNGNTSVSHVFTGDAGDSFPTGELTLAFWVNTTSADANAVLVAFTPAGAGAAKLTLGNPENLTLTFQGATALASGAKINDGQWHHVLVTLAPNGRTCGAVEFVVDGVPALQTPKGFVHAAGDWPTAAGTLALGLAGTGTGFTGDMSELELWSVALDAQAAATQLQRRAQAGTPGLALVWGLHDVATTGTVAGADPDPFVASTLQFRTAAAGRSAYMQATWSPVSGAAAYDFELYAADGTWMQSVTGIAAAALPLNIDGVLLAQRYQARGRSLDSGGVAGPWSAPVTLVPIDLAAITPALDWAAVDRPLLATWQPPDQVQSYLLLQTRDPPQSPAPVAMPTAATFVDLTADLSGDFGWTVGVQGTGTASVGPAPAPGPVAAPAMSFYYIMDATGGNGTFHFAWTPSASLPTYYYFEVIKGNATVLTALEPGTQSSPLTFASPVPVAVGDRITGVMRMLGGAAISHPATRVVTAQDIARPQLTWQAATSPQAEALASAWGAVAPGATYDIALDQDGGTTPIVAQNGSSALGFALTPYLDVSPAHSYTLHVTPVVDGAVGPASAVVTPPALASAITYVWTGAPTNAGVLTVAWTPVATPPGLQTYLRIFVDGAAAPSAYGAVALSSGAYTVTQPQGGYPEGTRVSYHAYGLGEGSMALPETGSAVLHRLAQPVVTLAGNAASLTLTAQWSAASPSAPGVLYQIIVDGAKLGTPQLATTYDLTSYLTAAGATEFQVEAALDNSLGQASATTAAPAPGPSLRYQHALDAEDTLTIAWTPAPIAYLQVALANQPVPVAKALDTAGTGSFVVPRPWGGFVEGNVYTAAVKTIANATLGAFVETSATIHQLAPPTVTFAPAPDPASVIAQWNDIRTQPQQGIPVDYQVRLNGADQGAPQAALTCTLAGLLDQAGAQVVTVQGQAQGSYGISSAPPALATPAAPTLAYDRDTQILSVSWPAVAGAQQYYATVTGQQNAVLARNWINPAIPTVSTAFTLGDPAEGVTYSVGVRALAGGALTSVASATLVHRVVPGPSIHQPMDEDAANHRIVVSWTFDPAACGLTNVVYIAQLYDAHGGPIGASVQTTNPVAYLTYPTGTQPGTTLQVRVRASGNGLLGAWSPYASLALGSTLAKPVISSFSFDASNGMTVTWGAVALIPPKTGEVVMYQVSITGPGLRSGVFSAVTSGTSLSRDAATTGVQNQQNYTATVQAIGPGRPGPLSDPVTAKSGTLTKPDQGAGGGSAGGDPISLATGIYTYSHVDMSVVGVVPLDFVTYYSSGAPLPDGQNPIAADKPMGRRWNHVYNTWLYVPNPQPSSNPYATVAWGNGVVSSYAWSDVIGPLPKIGRQDGSVLERNPDLTYTLILKDQTRYNFDTSGRLVTIVSNIGNAVALSYSGGRLDRVTDNGSGRYLAFTYFASGADIGRLQQVADNAGRHVVYAYTAGDLTGFTNVSGKSRTFTYWPQSLMKQATAENGVDVIVYNEYDSQQRVTLQRDGNQSAGAQGAYTINWSSRTGPNDRATTIAAVQDYAGHQAVYTSLADSQDTISTVTTLAGGNVRRLTVTYDGNGNVASETVYEGPASGVATLGNTVSATYDGNFNVESLVFSGDRGLVSFSHDAHNNLATYTDLLGNVSTTQFSVDNTLAWIDDPLGGSTQFLYEPGAIKGLVEDVVIHLSTGHGGSSNAANLVRMTHTARGQLETVTNPLGETTTFTYDPITGWLTSTTVSDADGTVTRTTTYGRDRQTGNVTTRQVQRYDQPLADASTETFSYDDRGNLQYATDALGRTTEYVYNPNNFLQTIIYPAENGFSERTSFTYTGDNLIETLTVSSANPRVVWGFAYDAIGRLTSRTDPNTHTTTFSYATATQQSPAAPTTKSAVYPLLDGAAKPYVQSLTFDSISRPTAVTDITLQGVTGGTTTLAYAILVDEATRAYRLKVTKTLPPIDAAQANPATEVFVYDAYGRLVSFQNAAGKIWATQFSLATTTNPATTQTVATVTDPLGNQVVTVTDPLGRVVERRRGRPAQGSTPAQWMTTTITYDSSGNPKRVVETGSDGVAKPATTYAYAYDAAAHLLRVTVTPYGVAAAASTYSYDKAFAYVGLQGPAGVTETRTYNSRGLLKSWADARGNVLQYAYDAAGRFTTTTITGGDTVTNVLDANGNRLQTTRNGTVEITRAFDALNRMTSRTDNRMGKTVGYAYTPMNRVATLTYPDVTTPLQYAYDGLQRLKSVTDWNSRTTTYTYWPAGKLQDSTYPNGVLVHQLVDDANRISGFTATVGGAVIASAACQFDAFSLPQTVDQVLPLGSNAHSDHTLTYGGDRLLTLDGANLAYDADGNITAIPGAAGALQYNALRQLTAVGAATLGYDLDGLQTGLVNGATSRRFIKDPRGYRAPLIDQANPTSAVSGTSNVASAAGPLSIAPLPPAAAYARPLTLLPARPPTLGPEQPDPFESLPMPDADPSGAFENMLDRTLVAENSDGTGRVRYVYGQGLISREADGGAWQSYVFDGLGSTLALVDASGTVTDRFAYSVFGSVLARQGATTDPFLYHGRYGVADFGLGPVLMRSRAYQPTVMRFTARDILYGNSAAPQTQNRYAFALGDPADLIDPLGLGGDHGDAGGGGGLGGAEIAGIAVAGVIGGVGVGAGAFAATAAFAPGALGTFGTSLAARIGTSFVGRFLARTFDTAGYEALEGAAEVELDVFARGENTLSPGEIQVENFFYPKGKDV